MGLLNFFFGDSIEARRFEAIVATKEHDLYMLENLLSSLRQKLRQHEMSAGYDAVYFHCHNEGLTAFENKQRRESNPHQKSTVPYEAWDDGWCCGLGRSQVLK